MGAAISEGKSDEIKPALILELVGWYQWQWGGANETGGVVLGSVALACGARA